ncbi:hypothetical protein MA16_Dca007372 [Dendrobium catenatum]|uniref:Uncharacterized protein n=1 Tax=Dendrobium catenatum TaxID=906689 RepID=A0A2I0W8L2_9ASPA|nr:hypothetical protein MA16_Dca007372 [Dendrobium catenatum]
MGNILFNIEIYLLKNQLDTNSKPCTESGFKFPKGLDANQHWRLKKKLIMFSTKAQFEGSVEP